MGAARIRKKLGLPPRTPKPAPTQPVPQNQQSYKVTVCAIVNNELKTMGSDEDFDQEKFFEGATYKNTFRVYENGFITPSFRITPKDGVETAATRQFDSDTRRFRKYLTEQFDQMYPETARMAKEFVSVFTGKVNELKNTATEVEPSGHQFDEAVLTHLLFQVEEDYLRRGSAQDMIGWGLRSDIVAMFQIGLPTWKYRAARAVSEVAKNVGAKFLVIVNEAWVRDTETGKRNGKDALVASIISPDGTVLYSASGTYLNKNGKIQVVEPIHGAKVDYRTEQRLFPAWMAVN
jgi:hypothetical protein